MLSKGTLEEVFSEWQLLHRLIDDYLPSESRSSADIRGFIVKVFRVNIPLQGLWYFDELVTVNSTAALDVKVVIKKCIMSMIRAALNLIPQLSMLAKSQSYKVRGSFHSWVNGK